MSGHRRSHSAPRRILRLLRSASFREHPVRAVYHRLRWYGHWLLWPRRPFVVNVPSGKLELARSSASAGIYVNGGGSDPDVAAMFSSFIEPGMVAVDCGAHIGEYTLLFAVGVGQQGRVHSFEPHPESFRVLSRNVALNDLRNVMLNRAAVADHDGSRRFVLHLDPTMAALAEGEGQPSTTRVDVIALDSYAGSAKLDRIDVLKVDVEGAEVLVLAGASKVLTELRPALVFVECHSPEARDAVEALLRRYAYEPAVEVHHVHAHVWARPTLTSLDLDSPAPR